MYGTQVSKKVRCKRCFLAAALSASQNNIRTAEYMFASGYASDRVMLVLDDAGRRRDVGHSQKRMTLSMSHASVCLVVPTPKPKVVA